MGTAASVEVETQGGAAQLIERGGDTVHDLVVHGATVERVRMAAQRRESRRPAVALLQQRLERPRWPGQAQRHEPGRALAAHPPRADLKRARRRSPIS